MRLPFGKKSESPKPRSARAERKAGSRPERTPGLRYDNSDESLPGICGYMNGPYWDSDHPSRFRYVRPDGREDDDPRDSLPEDAPAIPPSRRPVPRGFFGH